jgi:hypothetical protein
MFDSAVTRIDFGRINCVKIGSGQNLADIFWQTQLQLSLEWVE